MARTTVSVVIPAHNRAGPLARAVQSCLSQTHLPEEIIIVDDASTEDILIPTLKWGSTGPRIVQFRLETNQGPQVARFEGVKRSVGEWIAFLDSDDELLPDSIERRLKAALASSFKPGLIYGDLYLDAADPAHRVLFKKYAGNVYPALCRELSIALPSTIMVRRSVFETAGFPDLSLPAGEGQDLILTVARHFPILHCQDAVAVRHHSARQRSHEAAAMAAGCRGLVSKYRRDIVKYHGFFCYVMWRLRIISLDLGVLTERIKGPSFSGRCLKFARGVLRKALGFYFTSLPEKLFRSVR